MSYMHLVDATKRVKNFLELAQPLPVKYGYIRGVQQDSSIITYRNMSSNIRIGIGNQYISERNSFVITVQTETAEQNLIYSAMIKYATSESFVQFVSDDFRKDITVESGWINTIVVSAFSSAAVEKTIYTSEEVREYLQELADRFVMITSIYRDPYSSSSIDKFLVPELESRLYSAQELLGLKQMYVDKYILTITEY